MQQPNPYKEEKGEVRSTNSTAGNTPTEPKANLSQRSNKTWQTIFERVNSFINALAESRLSVRCFIELEIFFKFYILTIRIHMLLHFWPL